MDISCPSPVPTISNPTRPTFQSVLLTSNSLLVEETSTPLESNTLIVNSLRPGSGLQSSALRLIISEANPEPTSLVIESIISPLSSERIMVNSKSSVPFIIIQLACTEETSPLIEQLAILEGISETHDLYSKDIDESTIKLPFCPISESQSQPIGSIHGSIPDSESTTMLLELVP